MIEDAQLVRIFGGLSGLPGAAVHMPEDLATEPHRKSKDQSQTKHREAETSYRLAELGFVGLYHQKPVGACHGTNRAIGQHSAIIWLLQIAGAIIVW